MRRNSSRFSISLLLLALMLAVTLALAQAGTASAAPLHSTKAAQPVGSNCLIPAPSIQKVLVGQQANVDVTVECYPVSPFPYLYATWGDGKTSTYPVCTEVCLAPPFVIHTSHTYAVAGDYHPLFCPNLGGSTTSCVSVEIIVSL